MQLLPCINWIGLHNKNYILSGKFTLYVYLVNDLDFTN